MAFSIKDCGSYRLQIHTLTHYSSSNPNRDDLGRAKECTIGGVKRQRISSQCQKAAVRKSEVFDKFREYIADKKIDASDMTRNREIHKAISEEIDRNQDLQLEPEKKEALATILTKEISGSDKDDAKQQVIAYSKGEIRVLIQTLANNSELDIEDKDFSKKLKAEIKAFNKNSNRSKRIGRAGLLGDLSPELQLFGRMVTSDIFSNIDTPLSVMHSFTTHEVNIERDYWTAVGDSDSDDLKSGGSEHLSTRSFGSGVYYGYSCIDINLLNSNLESAFIELSEEQRHELCADIISAWLWGFATTSPKGYKTAFGHQNPSYFGAVEFGRSFPFNAAGAFEKPVELKHGEGYRKSSIEAFKNWDNERRSCYNNLPKVETYGEDQSFDAIVEQCLIKVKDALIEIDKGGQCA